MNAFSGFMQAVTGLVPGFGENTGSMGKNVNRLPGGDGTILSADDNTRSFLAWVQNFIDQDAAAGVDGQRIFTLKPGELGSDLPVLDQLKALMAGASDQFPDDPLVSMSLNGESLDNEQFPLPQGIINAIIAHHAGRHVADNHSHEASHDVPELMIAKENASAVGQREPASDGIPTPAGQADESRVKEDMQAFGRLKSAASGIPTPAGIASEGQIKEDTPAFGRLKSAGSGIPTPAGIASDGQVKANTPAFGQLKPAASGIPATAGQADERRPIENPVAGMMTKESRPEAGSEKGDAPALSRPAAPAGDEGQIRNDRLVQERLPFGPGTAGKPTEPATPHLQTIAGQTKVPESPVTVPTGQPSASSEDDLADSRGNKPHPLAQRVELADVNEEERQKSQSSDAAKNPVSEPTRPQASFQDTAKTVAADQTTNMAVKPATGQSAILTRTEDAAVKSFQTTVMDQIVDKAAMRSIHGRSEIQIRLKPEFLGNVQMNIAADKEQLVVRIMTDRPVVKEIIETHLHHLKSELQTQGLTIDKFEILVNPDANQQHSRDQFAQMFKHHFSQNGRQQSRGQDQDSLDRDGDNRSDDDRPNREGVNYFA